MMKNPKKLILALGLVASCAAAQAFAFSLAGGYTGPIKVKYSDYEIINLAAISSCIGAGGSGCANGVQDVFGIVDVTSILTPTNTPLWSKGTGGEELTGVFYGLDVSKASAGVGSFNAEFTGGKIDLYTNPVGTLNPANGTANYTNAAKTQYTGITGGTKFATIDWAPGVDPADGTITLSANFNSLTIPTKGAGSGFMNVEPGSGFFAGHLDSNGVATTFGNADLTFLNNFCTNGQSGCQGQNGPADKIGDWDLLSEDPISGRVIPEPGSLALLGLAMASIGLVGLRRKN